MVGEIKDVLLVGFGAVGAVYSLILKRGGLARVTAVARSNYDAINGEGVHFQSKKYGDIKGWRPDRLCKSVAEAADRPYDYIVVTTKAIPEVVTTVQILAPLLSKEYNDRFPQPTYMLLQNGLGVERDLYNALKALSNKVEPKIISCGLWIYTNLLAPNVVEHGDFDRVSIGVYRHEDRTTTVNTAEESSLLKDFADILETGGGTVNIVPEVQRVKFSKNLWNISFSGITTLTQYTLPAFFRPPSEDPSVSYEPYVYPVTADLIKTYTIPMITAILEELILVGRALGYPDAEDGLPSSLPSFILETSWKIHAKPDSTHVPSMLLDAQRGQPIEVEVIVGEVVRMAKERNVTIPRVETLYALLLVVQNQLLRRSRA
ncbi:6-phosphogluconate dehydrogenase [Gymnopilus junonius]|uniref:6-phosphogluconate dehydrogenase n=1 Tax=Gymnopilus junonius TaxID=109634 RepID=A0A9P5NLN2_GYMJU|nr:6-phosphogluconate dehydrogenase [Gymnopilus junonius]